MVVRKWYTEENIQAIADAIRAKDGDETKMLVTDMPARIAKLGGGADASQVNDLEHRLKLEIDRSAKVDEAQGRKLGELDTAVKANIQSLTDLNTKIMTLETEDQTLSDRIATLEEGGGASADVTNRLLDKLDSLEEFMREVEDIFEAKY